MDSMRNMAALAEDMTWERAYGAGRRRVGARLRRISDKRWQIGQCAVAAGVAWFVAHELFGHQAPVFASVAAVLSLGTSYVQRTRRVVEVAFGVAIGVFLGDLLANWLGQGAAQISLIVALSMVAAMLAGGGTLFINQAAVQSIFVVGSLATVDAGFVRWSDALIGGGVALVAASVVPGAPLRQPQRQAAVVVRKIATLLRATAEVIREADAVYGMKVLADARSTTPLIRELQAAAAEGIAVVAISPFRVRHRPHVRRMNDLIEPLDRAMRSTRVLVRQVAVAAYRGVPVPESYADLALALAEATEDLAERVAAHESLGEESVEDGLVQSVRPRLLELAESSGRVERSDVLNADAILLQLRSVLVDLLQLTGMGQFEATDALPPVRRIGE
ncbi:FUSC family protein [Nocardioides insulae]|uniref:FUSC family protein n=1 Tax=Nocardioides insulae TaxID=394734 RepID=UPI00048B26C3|nr:FUSC family protein [Nocardioides insulae]